MSDLFWVGPALVFGLLAARLGLPPMVGYLIGGFALNLFGPSEADDLKAMGDLGVTLLLFTIGLKLDVRSLLKPYVWAGASLHMLAVVLIFGMILFLVSLAGMALFAEVDFIIALLIAFALSFSSTVFAVKTLEDKGELSSRHGQIAMGILIMQDIFAVVFLAMSTGKVPSLWALGLFALFPLSYVLKRFMSQAGHGELLILFGFGMAFGAWALFDLAGVKGDLGALFVGALLAGHPSAGEMSKKLMGFKDVLLVGFFLSIGMTGHITAETLLIAMVLAVAVIAKVSLYFLILIRFRLRAHTSVLTSLSLANYSEFGLIVGAVAFANGWLSGDWLVIIALALTATFMAAAPLNASARKIFSAIRGWVSRFENPRPLPEDLPIETGDARFAIIGMARLGAGAYDTLKANYGDVLIGIDPDPAVVERHQAVGRNVLLADATNDDFWFRIGGGRVESLLLAMNEYEENLGAARRIQSHESRRVLTFAVADYPEQSEALRAAGVGAVWDLDTEAGTGFAEEVISHLDDQKNSEG